MRHKGTVASFNPATGYGFIAHEEDGDVFCHYSAILHSGYRVLKVGQEVEFDIARGTNGKLEAANVVVVTWTI